MRRWGSLAHALAPPLLPPLAHALGERVGGGGGGWHCGWDWGCLSWSLTHGVGGGGGSAEIPLSPPSPVLARSPPLPGPSQLLVRDSRSCSRNSGGLCRERTHSRSPRASRSSSRAACGERYRDRSRLVGSRVRTRVSRSSFTGRFFFFFFFF